MILDLKPDSSDKSKIIKPAAVLSSGGRISLAGRDN